MSLVPGLVSVTFRQLSTREIVRLAARAGLKSIEWGGDVHVPPGNYALAREIRKETEDEGLKVGSYGSYYRVGGVDSHQWSTVLNTAETLGAPNIRIWAGNKGSAQTDKHLREVIIGDICSACRSAEASRIKVSVEYHGGTLTDTLESTRKLIDEVNHPNLYTYWQPAVMPLPGERESALLKVLSHVSHVHVFQWKQGTAQRLPLADGAADWTRYLKHLAGTGKEHGIFMEFVKDDSPEQFLADAAVLKEWIAKVA